MKSLGSLSQFASYSLVLGGLVGFSIAQAADGSATATRVSGRASYSDGGPSASWKPLTVNQVLKAGNSAKTETGAGVDLWIGPSGGSVQLTSATSLTLDKLSLTPSGASAVVVDTGLSLVAGTIKGYVPQLAPGSHYSVKTPREVVEINAVQGPVDYQIGVDGMVISIKGQLLVASTAGGAAVTVSAGQTFTPPTSPTATGTVGPTTGGQVIPTPTPVAPGTGPSVGPVVAPVTTTTFVSPLPQTSPTTTP